MKHNNTKARSGFTLIELLIAMTIMLILMGIVATLVSRSMGVRNRETQKADALVSAQSALTIISREIANSGFGIYSDPVTRVPNNGIVLADSNASRIHIRANVDNAGPRTVPPGSTVLATNLPGEDVTYFHDATTNSIVRFDPNDPVNTTSVVVNRISGLTLEYFNYTTGSSVVTQTSTPTAATGRVRISVQVALDPIVGQPIPASVTFTSDVTLRNAGYMLQQY
jgi:prepilin-type N-terminal cleavage/methylation domain-containing protein